MAKTSLVSRMYKAGAPKTWIDEVQHMERKLETKRRLIKEYGNIIDALARQLEYEERAVADYERRQLGAHDTGGAG